MRLAVISTHPVQYYAPLFRTLARQIDIHVFYAHKATPAQQAAAGFGTPFDWDVDLMEGYESSFLTNVAAEPDTGRFAGCDTPEIGQRLSAGRFDALLTLGWHSKSLVQAIVAARRRGIPVMVRGDSQLGLQTNRIKLGLKRLSYPILLRLFRAALVVGSRNRDYFRHYGYPVQRLFASPHAVDTEFFSERSGQQIGNAFRETEGLSLATRIVLFAGKLLDFKRPLDTVDAVGRLRAEGRDVTVMIAGSGPLDARLRARAAELGVPLHVLGFVNQTAMPAVYAASDVLVLPSTGRETWGLVANEALACGVPIVVSDAAGCAPDLCDGRAGLSYPCGDIAALTGALRQTLSRPPDLEAIAARSAAHGLDRAADGVVAALAALRKGREG